MNKSENFNYQSYQNKFRGLISSFKSHRFNKGGTRSPSMNFRTALKNLLLEVRVKLHPHQFHGFLSWLNHHTESLLPELNQVSIGYEELSGIYTSAPEASLERELVWISARIKESKDVINAFRNNAQKIEHYVFKGELNSAIENLIKHEETHGASMWGIQLRLALEQQVAGLEQQKRYAAELRGIYKRGLLSFVALYTSIRNEDKTTLDKYFRDVKNRIDNHPNFEPFIKTYLHYRLAGEFPEGSKKIADILRVEQSHSLVDTYETFITVLQHLARNNSFLENHGMILRCLNDLGAIKDFRLTKLKFAITGKISSADLQARATNASDALISGKATIAALKSMRNLKSSKTVDSWDLVYAAFAFGHATRKRLSHSLLPHEIPILLGNVLSRNTNAFNSITPLFKLLLNLNGLPTTVGISDLLHEIHKFQPENGIALWKVGLNSPSIGIEDYSIHQNYAAIQTNSNLTERLWKSFHTPSKSSSVNDSPIFSLFTSCGFVNNHKYDYAITLIENNIESLIEPLRSIANSVLLQCNYAKRSSVNVISLIADEGSRSEVHRILLPITPALEGYKWDDFKAISSKLSLCIALHLLWLENENEETRSLLRFAVRQFLKDPLTHLPSQLCDKFEDYPKHQLVYFLRHVCVPNILDVSLVLKSTKEVMEERQNICAELRFLDSVNADIYQEEITSISHMQKMDEGQWMIDSTRIHVDTEALTRWAKKELSEAYSRYRDLLLIDAGPQIDLDELLKTTTKEALSKYSSFSPETEADALLINMLGKIMEEFLNNSSFGLDFYLSKRIRHQSFISKIRGPLEFAQLITTKESESGSYHPNNLWLEKLSDVNEESKLAISEAFTKFSTRFDDALVSAKDNNFQIRSTEHPDGLLYLNISPMIIFFTREVSRLDKTLEEFINTTVMVMWAAIGPSLLKVRQFITKELKANAATAFDELRATVKKYSISETPAFLDLDVTIGKCSSEVQTAFNEAAQWFNSANGQIPQDSFDLEQMLDISINVALKCQRGFEPKITKNVINADIKLNASTLIFLHDVLFVALDNARAHSGVNKPRINILTKINLEEETFLIEVRSETKLHNRESLENNLNEIRTLISAGKFESRTRKEGKSGFLKLAADVHQNPKGKIDFGINEKGEFQLRVIYSLILGSAPEGPSE